MGRRADVDLSPEKRAQRRFVSVDLGGRAVQVPALDSMTAVASIALSSAMKAYPDQGNERLLVEYLRLYLGDVVDTLSPAEFAELAQAVSAKSEVGAGE
jgi:hypothetical protein